MDRARKLSVTSPSAGVARLTVHQERPQINLDASKAMRSPEVLRTAHGAVTAATVREEINRRREREQLFGDTFFSDPAWDILLQLFLAELEQQRVAVSQLGQGAVVPGTTALRWMEKLERSGWASRRADPLDARRVFVELSPPGREAMERWFRPRER